MQTVTKEELQANMMSFFQEVEKSGTELIVTENGRPVLSIQAIPYERHKRPFEEVFADLHGKVVFHEDPDTPTTDDWEDV